MKNPKSYNYAIHPRPEGLGGGYKVSLFEDGREVGGGVYPIDAENGIDDAEAHNDAFSFAEEWIEKMRSEDLAPEGGGSMSDQKAVQVFKLKSSVDEATKDKLREEIKRGIESGILLLDSGVDYIGCLETPKFHYAFADINETLTQNEE